MTNLSSQAAQRQLAANLTGGATRSAGPFYTREQLTFGLRALAIAIFMAVCSVLACLGLAVAVAFGG